MASVQCSEQVCSLVRQAEAKLGSEWPEKWRITHTCSTGAVSPAVVPIAAVRAAVAAIDTASLSRVLAGTTLVYPKPAERVSTMSDETRERLRARIQHQEYTQAIGKLERGLAAASPTSAGSKPDSVASLRSASSVGTEVVFAMLSLGAFGYYMARTALGTGSVWPPVAGLAGALIGLFVEVWLYIIRSSREPDS